MYFKLNVIGIKNNKIYTFLDVCHDFLLNGYGICTQWILYTV
jgi:hypothetical protein